MQYLQGKIRYFHGVAVAFFQDAEAVRFIPKQQFSQFLPVIQPVTEMNILGYISHNGIRTGFDAEMQHGICHHPVILCFIDDNVMGFADYLGLLDPFVNIGQCRQVIDVKFQ